MFDLRCKSMAKRKEIQYPIFVFFAAQNKKRAAPYAPPSNQS